MSDREDKVWADMEKLIDDQLRLQVQIQFPSHHRFLIENGIETCRSVVDLGTGNGAFLQALARAHPDIRFSGIDSKQRLIDHARSLCTTNIEWIWSDVTKLDEMEQVSQADGVLMRYLLLHLKETSPFLSHLRDVLRAGARVWIIDLDLERSSADPPHAAFEMIKGLVRTFCDQHGQDCNIGSKLSRLLSEAGFRSIRQGWDPLNTREVDLPLFQKFILQEVMLYRAFIPSALNHEELAEIRAFIEGLPSSKTHVNYGVTMVAGIR